MEDIDAIDTPVSRSLEELDVLRIADRKTKTKLNGHNYNTWAIDAEILLQCLGLWLYVTGGAHTIPRPPATASTPRPKNALDPEYDFKPEFTDSAYMLRFNRFLSWWEEYQNKRLLAYELILSGLEPSIQSRYRELEHGNPKKLWDTLKADFEKVISRFELQTKLVNCKLESYPSVTAWIAAQDSLIRDLAIHNIKVDESLRKFFILSNLPSTNEWTNFAWNLELSGKADMSANIMITHLLSFEARLRRDRGIAPDAPLFASKKARSRKSKKAGPRPERVHQASR